MDHGRRALAAALAIAFGTGPGTAGAAAAAKKTVHRIGVLGPNEDVRVDTWNEFVAELKRRGYEEGKNLVFERRVSPEGRVDLLNRNAASLAALNVDVIYAVEGTLSALAAKNATQRIPIVFNSSADPVGFGVVESLAHPGGNVTGNSISSLDTIPKSLQLLAEAAGRSDLRIVAFMPARTRSLSWFTKLSGAVVAAASRLGARFEFVEVESVGALELALKRLAREGIGAVSMDFAQEFDADGERIAAALIAHRLPSIGNTHAGFLLEYQPSLLPLARKAAEYVDKILRGARPADLPVEQASDFALTINLKTAHALDLRISPSLQMRAAKLIR